MDENINKHLHDILDAINEIESFFGEKPGISAMSQAIEERTGVRVQTYTFILLEAGIPFPPHAAVRMDMSALSLAAVRRDNLFYRARQYHVAERNTEKYKIFTKIEKGMS